jgi:hypothetical protein
MIVMSVKLQVKHKGRLRVRRWEMEIAGGGPQQRRRHAMCLLLGPPCCPYQQPGGVRAPLH